MSKTTDPLNRIKMWAAFATVPNQKEGTDWWEVTKGFAAGIGGGAWHFVEGLATFVWNGARHPVDTVVGIYRGVMGIVDNIRNGEYEEVIAKSFPELYKLAKHWDTLSDYEKGHLVGEVVGKYAAGTLTGALFAKLLKQLNPFKKKVVFRREPR